MGFNFIHLVAGFLTTVEKRRSIYYIFYLSLSLILFKIFEHWVVDLVIYSLLEFKYDDLLTLLLPFNIIRYITQYCHSFYLVLCIDSKHAKLKTLKIKVDFFY